MKWSLIGICTLLLCVLSTEAQAKSHARRKAPKGVVKRPPAETTTKGRDPAVRDTSSSRHAPSAPGSATRDTPAAINAPAPRDGVSAQPMRDMPSVRTSDTPAAPARKTITQTPIIDVFAGVRTYGRVLSFTDDLFGQFYPYRVLPAPSAALALEYFPGGHAGSGWYSHIGIIGAFEYGFGVSSRVRDDPSVAPSPTQVFGGYAGLKARWVVGPVELFVDGAFGLSRFGFTAPAQTIVMLSTEYQYVRPGLGVRVAIWGPLAAFCDAQYIAVLSAGSQAREMFPRAQYQGISAGAGLGVQLYQALEARLRVDYRRIGAVIRPEVEDAYVLGGFLDQNFGVTLGLALRL